MDGTLPRVFVTWSAPIGSVDDKELRVVNFFSEKMGASITSTKEITSCTYFD
jgi:hypothetical protein